MLKSGQTEMKTKDIDLKKMKKRVRNLEKINGIRNQASELASNRSFGKLSSRIQQNRNQYYEDQIQENQYPEYPDDHQAIQEQPEQLEYTGEVEPPKPALEKPQFSKTPNMRLNKNKSGKIGIVEKLNPYRNAKSPQGAAHQTINPFDQNVGRGYDHYVDQLEHGDMKNNSNHIQGIFSYSDRNF